MKRLLVISTIGIAGLASGFAHAEPAAEPSSETKSKSVSDSESASGADTDIDASLLAFDDDYVVIIDGKAPLPATATTRAIDAETISLSSRRSADDLLRLVPGLHTSAHGAEGKGQQFFLRGFDAVHGSDLEIRVAGVPVNELSNVHGQGYVDIGFVIPEVVAQVAGSKGSFQLDQGNFATAGSVRFELGVPELFRGNRLSYEIGTTGRHRVLGIVAPKGEDQGTFAAVEALSDNGYGINRGTQRISALGQYHKSLGGNRWLRAFASGYAARFGEPGPVPVADLEARMVDFYGSYADDTEGRSTRFLSALTLHDHGADWRFDATAHMQWRQLELDENFTGFLLFPDMGDRRQQAHQSLSGGAQLALERDLSATTTLLAGAEGVLDSIVQSEDQITEAGMIWQENRALDAVQLGGNARLGIRAALGESLTVQAGARVDAFHFDSRDQLDDQRSGSDLMLAVSPRVNAAWRVSDGVSLFAAYGRGFRAPEARSVTTAQAPMAGELSTELYDGGESQITTSDSGELGARWKALGNLEIGGGVFATYLQNEMLFDHLSGVNVQLDGTRRLGVELDVQYAPAPWLRLRGDVSAVDGRFVGSGDPIPGAPRFLASAEARFLPAASWRAGAQFRFMAPRPLAHGATGEAVSVLDASVEYRLGRWQLGAQIDNVLGTRWREGEFHFASWHDRSQPRSQLPQAHYTAGRPFGVRATLTSWF